MLSREGGERRRKTRRRRQNIGYLASFTLGLALVIVFFLPGQEHLHALGPMNTGHETLMG